VRLYVTPVMGLAGSVLMMSPRAFLRAGAMIALLAVAAPAAADPPSAATRLYAAGNFMAAAELAEAQNSSSSLAFAARALLAECLTAPDRESVDALITRAEQAAQDSLALDAQSVDARLQLALAIGMRGRRATLSEAIRHGYAQRGRRLIEEALQRAPDEPWAHALMGGWHLEVLRRGGRAGAIAYGARVNTGIAEFERARALAPNDPLIALQFAVALIELDSDRYAVRAGDLLRASATAHPHDAFEAHAVREARRLAGVLDREGPAAADRAVRIAFL
jgi:multidrug efflux pump subunit AcrA (membrane-fusion protein)